MSMVWFDLVLTCHPPIIIANPCCPIDKIGLHRIANPSMHTGAVSLHLYTPPYETCKTFEEQTGRSRSSGKCSFYSVGGRRSIS
jgi:hypothetical protein